MHTIFTRLALVAFLQLSAAILAAQPVTTVASINYEETIYIYDFDDDSVPDQETKITFGTTMNLDFTAFGDREIEYGPDGNESAPASTIPLSELVTVSIFEIDETFRASLDTPLPDDVVGLRIDYGEGDIEDDILLIEPDILTTYAYGMPSDDGDEQYEVEILDSYEPFLPLNLEYGETYEIDTTYLRRSSDYEGKFDSVILHATYTYSGYGVLKTWRGEENVGALLLLQRKQYFRVNENGSYGEPDQYNEDGLFLMNGTTIVPRVTLYGSYDADSETFTVEDNEFFLFLPGNDISATGNLGIPNAIVSIAPNPTAGPFHVNVTIDRGTSLELELHNAAGQLVTRQSGLPVNPGLNRLPVVTDGGLPAGLYLVRLTTTDGRFETRRVVVR